MTSIKRNNILTTTTITVLVYILNQPTAIYQCAAIFTAIVFIANTQILNNKTSKAYPQLLVGIFLSLPMYALMEISNTQITVVSLLSLAFTGCLSIYVTNRLQNSYRFTLVLGISLLLASIVDGIIMSSYFLIFSVFATKTIINILNREIIFKMIYSSGILTIMFLVEFCKSRRSIR